jgi:hypothetical protein
MSEFPRALVAGLTCTVPGPVHGEGCGHQELHQEPHRELQQELHQECRPTLPRTQKRPPGGGLVSSRSDDTLAL